MTFRDHLLSILEGFEDHDGVIREVKTDDILTALVDDLDPVWKAAPDLLTALRPFADLMESPGDYPSTAFEVFVEVQDVAYAQQIVADAEGQPKEVD